VIISDASIATFNFFKQGTVVKTVGNLGGAKYKVRCEASGRVEKKILIGGESSYKYALIWSPLI
jgi:hypothetical protein